MTTPREQLAQIIGPSITTYCLCGQPILMWGPAARIADAIIQAGWTPPPTPAVNPTLHN